MSGQSRAKSHQSHFRGNQVHDRTLPLTIPTLFITSEDDSNAPTPLLDTDGSVNVFLQHPQLQYVRDEDANSTAPLLDSGAATPIGEEPSVPLTLSSFMSSGSEKLCTGEDIVMSPLEGKDLESTVEVRKLPNYPFVHWPWAQIRSSCFFLAVAAILGCFSTSVTMMIHQPSVCNPPIGWWQGKTFISITDDGARPLLDVLLEPARLDHLHRELRADVIRIDSASLTDANSGSRVDVDRPIHLLPTLVDRLEARNLSLVVDVHVDRLSADQPIADRARRCEEEIVFWLRQGVHGLYLQGLHSLVNHTDLWQYVAQWRAIVDGSSSVSRQQRILIVSSAFLAEYGSRQSAQSTRRLVDQFDMVDHQLDLHADPVDDLKLQLEDGLRWDNGSGTPWILWNAGDPHDPRRADPLETVLGGEACSPTAVGPLMLLMSLPGSASIGYSRDVSATGGGMAPGSPSAVCLAEAVKTLGRMNQIRREAVPLYTNAPPKCRKEQTLASTSNNYIYRSISNLTLLERYYPRRHRYLTVVNLQTANVTTDLSTSYYGGLVLLSSSGSKAGYVQLGELHLQPAEGLLLLLDK